jgi:catechol 2,3-dioxygenase-like lactoylglutathione lyase family enzyme
MITKTRHVLAVPDLQRSLAYYRDVLGFEIREIGDDGWRFFILGAFEIMAGHCPDALPPIELGDHNYFAYVILDDLDAYHDRVAATGAQLIKHPRNEPWGMREFAVRTIDGHRIMFGRPL